MLGRRRRVCPVPGEPGLREVGLPLFKCLEGKNGPLDCQALLSYSGKLEVGKQITGGNHDRCGFQDGWCRWWWGGALRFALTLKDITRQAATALLPRGTKMVCFLSMPVVLFRDS